MKKLLASLLILNTTILISMNFIIHENGKAYGFETQSDGTQIARERWSNYYLEPITPYHLYNHKILNEYDEKGQYIKRKGLEGKPTWGENKITKYPNNTWKIKQINVERSATYKTWHTIDPLNDFDNRLAMKRLKKAITLFNVYTTIAINN